MDALQNWTKDPRAMGALGLVVGLIIGLPILGWGLWPVRWTDATPAELAADSQKDYVRMAVDAFALTRDVGQAQARAAAVGENLDEMLTQLEAEAPQDAPKVSAFRSVAGATTETGNEETTPATPIRSLLRVLPFLCVGLVLLLALAGGYFYLTQIASRAPKPAMANGGSAMPRTVAATTVAEVPPSVSASPEPPIQQFMTTYTLGDDHYDDSFSIDAPSGTFLGECGVGISETIGVGDPKKVTSFEVWLFDKNDIRTVTKVLMSEHAFKDEALRSRLSAKGEPVMARPGETLVLETASLRVTARVVDQAYGGGALPPNSFFDRMTIELMAWQKPPSAMPVTPEEA